MTEGPDAMRASDAAKALRRLRSATLPIGALDDEELGALDMAIKRLEREARRGDGEHFCGARKT